MRCCACWVALFLALPLSAQVQDESPAPVRTYNLLRENDDWSFLADPSLRADFWDRSNTSRLGVRRATSVSAAKSVKLSSRSEMTTGENSGT
jgi:hypothetical protein